MQDLYELYEGIAREFWGQESAVYEEEEYIPEQGGLSWYDLMQDTPEEKRVRREFERAEERKAKAEYLARRPKEPKPRKKKVGQDYSCPTERLRHLGQPLGTIVIHHAPPACFFCGAPAEYWAQGFGKENYSCEAHFGYLVEWGRAVERENIKS